jgi:hypothetical protein
LCAKHRDIEDPNAFDLYVLPSQVLIKRYLVAFCIYIKILAVDFKNFFIKEKFRGQMSNIKKTSILCLATKPRDQKIQGDPQRATSSKIIMNLKREIYCVFPQLVKYEKNGDRTALCSVHVTVKWIKATSGPSKYLQHIILVSGYRSCPLLG